MPSSATVTVTPSPSMSLRAEIQIRPPPVFGYRPWLMAFSAKVCSIMVGNGTPASSSGN
jgi:hypothetical protein